MRGHRSDDGTFEVVSFAPAEVTPAVDIATALPTGVVTMEKRYTGGVSGTATGLGSPRKVNFCSAPSASSTSTTMICPADSSP